MTRKKNNVKALALAVTCAILAGGYSGLSPVYAAVTDHYLYKNGGTLDYGTLPTSATQIKDLYLEGALTVNQIGTNAIASTAITTKVINATDSLMISGNKFSIDGVTTLTGGGTLNISDANDAITAYKATGDNALVKKSEVDTAISTKANTADVYTKTDADGKFALQTTVSGIDGRVTEVETKTQDIKYETDGSTTVDGVNFNGGAVTGATSINNTVVGGVTLSDGTIEAASGKFKVYNNGAIDAANGAFKVGSSGTITAPGLQTHSNGSITLNDKLFLNAADASLQDKTTGKVVSISNLADDHANVAGITRTGDTASGYTTTIENNVTVDKDGNVNTTGNVQGKDITATGALKGATLSTTGNATVGGNLNVTGTSTFTGETTFSGGIKTNTISEVTTGAGVTVNGNKITTDNKFNDVTLKGGNVEATNITATGDLKGKTLGIGSGASEFAIDANGNVTKATSITADENNLSTIGGVKLQGKKVTADTVEVNDKITTKDLKVTGHFSVGDFETNNLTVNTKLTVGTKTTLEDGTLILGTDANHTLTKDKLKTINETINNAGEINTSKATIGTNTTVASTGINTNSITSTTGTIGEITLSGKNITGVQQIKANEFYADANNVLNTSGIKASQGTIGTVSIGSTGAITGVTTLNASETITAKSFKASESTHLTDKELKIDAKNNWTSAGITANAATIGEVNTLDNDGLKTNKVTFINSYLSEGDLHLSDKNYWTDANGITATQAAINGVTIGETEGKATFNNSQGSTIIDGNTINTGTITADELLIDKISLGKYGSKNITIDDKGNVSTKGDITVTGTDSDTTVIDGAKASFGKETDKQTIIDKGNITATAHDRTTHQQSKLTHNEEGFTVAGKGANNNDSSFNFSTKTGIGTFTGQDGTTTTINGSSITSKISDSNHGVLNGSNLTLTNGSSLTKLTAGGVTYDNGTDKTVVDGGTITTETLKTNKLILGNQTGDKDIVLNADGSLSAANGAFSVDVNGRTTFKKDADNQTAINGGNIYAQAKSTSGAKSKLLHTGNGLKLTGENSTGDVKTKYEFNTETGKATIEKDKGGVKSSTTVEGSDVKLDDGKNNKTNITAGSATFTKDSGEHAGTTTIDGNTIKTGHLITDKLTITGKGDTTIKDADGNVIGGQNGSIGFGGNGTITSDIREVDAEGNVTKNTNFTTNIDGVTTKVTNSTTTTTNEVTASGNTNTVKDVSGNNSSEFTQTTTSIGGVVTNGTVKMKQELTSEGLSITNGEADPKNITKISDTDVSITNPQNSSSRINLSDLGSLGDLNEEITSREEYTSNKTAVGAINAEAGIRREEVARLDGRINDVNDRVNKVGAMAAAIASLKSIGYDPQAPSEFSIGLGQYKGETGVAMGFFHYPNKNFMINVSLSTAGGETMGGIGATWRFGHKSPQKLLEEQREVQAKKELAAAEKYQAAAKLAKEAQERAEYAAKLARQAQVSADNAKAAADATQAKHF